MTPSEGPGEEKAAIFGELLELVVANDDVEAVRTALLAGERLVVEGRQLAAFSRPLEYLGVNSLFEVEDVNGVLRPALTPDGFYTTSEYDRGVLLLVKEPYMIEYTGVFPPLYIDALLGIIPFAVSGTQENRFLFYNWIDGSPALITDYLLNGRVTTDLEPASFYRDEGSGVDATKPGAVDGAPDDTPSIAYSFPVGFNQVELSDLVRVSGSCYVSPGPIGMTVEVDEELTTEISVSGEFTIDLDFLLEVLDGVDNTAEPLAEREATVLSFPLMAVTLPNGFTLVPKFSVNASAAVAASAGLALPFNTEVKVTFRGGHRDGEPFYDCDAEVVSEQLISGLTLHQEVLANVTTELEFQVDFDFYPGNQTLLTNTVSFSAAAVAELELDSTADPIWTLGGDLEIRAGMDIEIFEVLEIFEAEETLFSIPLFSTSAPGAAPPAASLFATHSATDGDLNPGLPPIHGEKERWTRLLRAFETISSTDDLFIVPLEGSSDVIVGDKQTISRVSDDGALRWTRHSVLHTPIAGVAEPDGGYTLLASRLNRVEMTRYDADDELVWMTAHGINDDVSYTPIDLVRRDAAAGGSEYFALGRGVIALPYDRFPALTKLDDAGQPLWHKVYEPNDETPDAEPRTLILASDGNLVVACLTNVDVDGTDNIGLNFSDNILLAKFDGGTGTPLWGHVYGSLRTPFLEAMEAGPDGQIFLGGRLGMVVTDSEPSALLIEFDAAGDWTEGILFGPEDTVIASPYDTVYDLLWQEDTLWAAGRIGLYSGVTGDIGASAFSARFNDRFRLNRYTFHAGPSSEGLYALAPADDGRGLFAMGRSASFLPWPEGAESEADNTPESRLLMKLPWEGIQRFHPLSAGTQDAALAAERRAGTHFLLPRVFSAVGSTFFEGYSAVSFVTQDLSMTSTSTTATPVEVDTYEYKALEFAPESAVDGALEYLVWAQLDGDGNVDGDALTNLEEIFWGTDLFGGDDGPGHVGIQAIAYGDGDGVELNLERAVEAAELDPAVQFSLDLEIWDPLPGFELLSEPSSATHDLLRLRFAVPDPSEEVTEFYRVSGTTPEAAEAAEAD